MAVVSPAVHRLFAAQHGAASVEQLLSCGTSRNQLRRLESDGALLRVLNSAYRSPSVPFGELSRCAALCLARPHAVIAGPTAGRLWGFRRLPRDARIHALCPPGSHPAVADWIVPYRTSAFHSVDVVERSDGIRVTSRARTAFDLARWLGPEDLLSVIEQAIHDGGLHEHEMVDVATDWLSPQRRWATVFLRQLDRRLPGGAAESHPEVRVARRLEHLGLAGIVRQFPIDLPGFGGARFDLALPALRWAIEIDVHPRHEETGGALADRRRDLAAGSIGWSVSRISRTDYEHDLDRRLDEVAAEYRSRSASPTER